MSLPESKFGFESGTLLNINTKTKASKICFKSNNFDTQKDFT